MAGQVRVVWDEAAVRLATTAPGSKVQQGMSLLADGLVLSMKYRCPVYSGPERGPVPGHPRQRRRKSGTLRSSIRKLRLPDGNWIVGPTDKTEAGDFLGPLIERGTPAHPIASTGPWPLYNAATGSYFGRRVNHPGTAAQPFIAPAAADLAGRRIVIR